MYYLFHNGPCVHRKCEMHSGDIEVNAIVNVLMVQKNLLRQVDRNSSEVLIEIHAQRTRV